VDAFIKATVISTGATRSWTSKKGEQVTVQDCYLLVGDSPRPVSASAEPGLGLKPGEVGMMAVSVFPSRFDSRDLSITVKGRVQADQKLRSA
jgi:hypothetical protein